MRSIDTFTRGYIECALWSSMDDDGEPLDCSYGIDDIGAATLDQMIEDCADFQSANPEVNSDPERGGHDFWLTRNRHGAGFWDGRWCPPLGERLTEASHAYGSFDLYVGDDGMIYGN